MSHSAHGDAVFVSGGTGTQGTATIRALLRLASATHPISIHALVRDPDSTKAQALAQLSPSVKLFKGDNDDRSAIAAAAESCTACFFILLTGWDQTDSTAERRQADTILSVLSSITTMRRVVYTTTAGVRDPSIPGNFKNLERGTHRYAYFEGKYANEMAVQKTAEENGWAWTIFKPAYFLSNFLKPMAEFMYPQLAEHRIVTVMPADWKYYLVDPDDIGLFCAVAVIGPGKGRDLPDLSSQKIDLVSQVGLLTDVTGAMERALAKHGEQAKIKVEHITADEAQRRGIDSSKTEYEQFLAGNPTPLDLQRVKDLGFELGTLDGFFEREMERLKLVLAL
ncbi:uncharacterized protein Z519_05928 [Cladophialophora bantiana CBS 173.52]|uniref:NmrA-like domain-containing protein n=1 Tax=Cladophialophora bantiana (strain ATCC 10958 / CBS 173.52 / CDC B-1940 / NIH 8579) TaxID=1442370 RepID=A0A0D2HJ41_CLAB1|nr:uncharacterized protein Z519_05928 [Cladophialophora bantiana CBS 173.52]KIW93323.1 hypothetical protein Z519_05928 [Cladophialophora bantiana CBS 173.52]